MPTAIQSPADLRVDLARILGADHVLTGDEDRAFYSQDIYSAGQPAAMVIRPGTREELATAVAAATAAGCSVIPRGGAKSYTGGFLPDRPESVMVDFGRLDRVVDVDARNMFVTVEAGCTWKTLYETLAEHGAWTTPPGACSRRSRTRSIPGGWSIQVPWAWSRGR